MRTNPRPTLEAMKVYYPEHYGPYLSTAADLSSRARGYVRETDTAIPDVRPGRLLEIGAASGNFLVTMQRRGWDVAGIEVDLASAERAATRTGARVICGDIGSVSLEHSQFDLICGWMVFEHVHDPVRGFQRCLDWLKPGGWLAFSVPDCGSWQFRTFKGNWYATQVPTHLYHFTAPSLVRILARCGFESVRIRWQRTLIDVPLSLALAAEDVGGTRVGGWARVAANSLPVRIAARALGCVAGPLRLTGRLTVWAKKPTDRRSDARSGA